MYVCVHVHFCSGVDEHTVTRYLAMLCSLAYYLNFFLFLFLFVCFKTGFLFVALGVLELTPIDQAGLKLRDLPASAS